MKNKTTTQQIWIEYHDKLSAFIKARVSDDVITQDILQDIFIKIHSQIATLKEETKLEAWIYQITRHSIIDYYRSKKTIEKLPDWLEQSQAEEEEIIRQELSLCLIPMIEQLPAKYRLAIQLSELEGKTQKEVAEKENISLSGAKSRVQRGRKLLKAMLLDCCELELNRKNQVTAYTRKQNNCKFC